MWLIQAIAVCMNKILFIIVSFMASLTCLAQNPVRDSTSLKLNLMTFKNPPLIFFLIIICFSSNNLFAQDNSSGIKLFFEKVYLHMDKTYYASGDDIWFKAYLVNAQSNYPVNTSNNLYVELINPINKIVTREVVRLNNGIGVGDFKLDDSIAGGSYRIRAYTNWMRNFGTHFIFEKEIQVKNITGVNKKNSIVEKVVSVDKKTSTHAYKIQFFPEGGSLVEGISSVVAFKAEDGIGNGINATGSILSSKGDTVVHFKTSHLGMGSFNFKPETGIQYKAFVQYQSSSSIPADFPVATPDGFVMKVTDEDPSNFLVYVFSNTATLDMHPTGEITIAGKHAGKIFYNQKTFLKDGKASLNITKKDFPSGIASITLYDENLHPYCERLVYIEDADPLTINLSPDKNSYRPREKVTVNISVTDARQHPVKANLSMAAIDDGIEKPSTENILSYLMLQSEVTGKIENAADYFNKNNPQRFQQLDLLLRAQGWRSFLWRQMADTSIHISYLPEPGITISGKVTLGFGNKPAPNMNITLLAPAAKGNKIFITKTNASGRYYLDGLPLYGNQTIKINSKNDKDKRGGELFIDSLFNNVLPVDPNYTHTADTSFKLKQFAEESAKRLSSAQNTKWYSVLSEVVVTSKRNTVVLRDGEGYMNFGFPEYNFTITSNDYQNKTVEDFLVQKIPGAEYDVEKEGINFIANGKPVRARFIVDKREDVFERIDYYRVPLTQVISISVRHMVGMNLTDVFLIYLDLKPGAYNTDPAFINTDVTGYYEARNFYSPNYENPENKKPDERTTIHWEPMITTDENGKATVNFYNADPKTRIRIDVQGVTDKGVSVVSEAKYDVK